MNHQTSSVSQIAYQSPQVTTQPMIESPLIDSSFVVYVFSPGDDPITCLNKAMSFLTTVASSRFPSTNNQLRTSSNLRNQATIPDGRVTVQQLPGRQGQSYYGTGETRTKLLWYWTEDLDMYDSDCDDISNAQAVLMANISNYGSDDISKTEDLDMYDSDCDDISNAQAVLMANISNYGSDDISKVPHSETYLNDMENQNVHAVQDFKQTPVVDVLDNKIHSDRNIIPYSQYLEETQQANVQDTHSQIQQDSMILSVLEQLSEQMIN
nr:hypothetical protein [Tanacetum cinerariifolium]